MTGFKSVPRRIAKYLRVASPQAVKFIFTLQNDKADAQAFSHLGVYLAPFIRNDGLSQKEIAQVIQELIFNMNVPTKVGRQSPSAT